jgi:glycosyltransferase involved in cell wall biosynthesis
MKRTHKGALQGTDVEQAASFLRVLMIAPTSFFADYGCHVRILEEIQILQKMGHQVTVATYHNGNDIPGINIQRTLPIPWRKEYEVGSSRHKIAFDALLGAKSLGLVLRNSYDIIHAHLHEGALIGQILSRWTGIPLVFDFQGSLTEEMIDHGFLNRESRFYKPLRNLEIWLDRRSNCVLTSSFHAERLLVDEFGCEPQQVHTLPDCVNSDSFCTPENYAQDELIRLRTQLGIPEGRKLIVYLGLLASHQGISHLLLAMQQIVAQRDNVHLLLMGFPGVDMYARTAQDLGIADHVTLPGRIPYPDAPRHLALGDVAVAPKLSTTEGSGKLLNYMAVGLPTVAFDTPVAHEYLGKDGLFAKVGDVEDLAAKLMFALDLEFRPSELSRIREGLRNRAVQRFSWDQAGQRIISIYQRLLNGEKPVTLEESKQKYKSLSIQG